MKSYDVLYQQWLEAHRAKNFSKADRLREEFEYAHGLTIVKEGDKPVIGDTVKEMPESKWQIKYGSPKLGKLIATQDSKIRAMKPVDGISRYTFMSARGAYYSRLSETFGSLYDGR